MVVTALLKHQLVTMQFLDILALLNAQFVEMCGQDDENRLGEKEIRPRGFSQRTHMKAMKKVLT